VSRKHTSISVVRTDKFTVTDLASRNGTFVNGARASSQDLKHNDLIRIGDTTFRFTVFDGPIPVTQ
jgi:pSer/pThr/pTyr-binding forkhead associated (FHA) protein